MTVDPVQMEHALRFVRPRLRGHAGDITVDIDDQGRATVHFSGACDNCPSMAVTYAGLVQTSLEAVPGITQVRAPQVNASPHVLASIRRRLGAHRATAVEIGFPKVRTFDGAPEAPHKNGTS